MTQIVGLSVTGAGLVTLGVFLVEVGGLLLIPAALILWLAVSVMLALSAYLVQLRDGTGGRLFFKRSDGSFHPVVATIYLPFTCSRYFNRFVYRLFSREPTVTDMGSGVLVGGRIVPWDIRAKGLKRIAAILDVTAELPRDPGLRGCAVAYTAVPVLDGCGPTLEQLASGVEWGLQQLQAGRPVLVQCLMGHGRSATFAAAMLLASGQVRTVEEAVDHMRSRRSRIGLNHNQKKVLEQALSCGVLGGSEESTPSAESHCS